MPPLRRGSSSYHGVRERPSCTSYAEIRSNDMRLGLGTFDTDGEPARAYDAVAWRLNRPRRDMNFLEVMTWEWTQRLAPPRGLSPKRTVARTGGGSTVSA
uniref:AP2/ERF domain-containing protein n=1 Tax=Hordeum vulgare subsp. vulgare TaxID=112509 RepID=A0A8I6YCA9_HORVV